MNFGARPIVDSETPRQKERREKRQTARYSDDLRSQGKLVEMVAGKWRPSRHALVRNHVIPRYRRRWHDMRAEMTDEETAERAEELDRKASHP